MSQVPPYSSQAPALAAPLARLDSLDLLRGAAILGIFLMNTWTMSMPQQAYTNPAAYSPDWEFGKGFYDPAAQFPSDPYVYFKPLTGLNYAVYVFIHLLADMKFITIFSILFGAGIVLQSERAAKKRRNPWLIHYLRMVVLLVFGLLHAYGLWYGDILFAYAVCGILLAPLRLLPPTLLMLLAFIMIFGVTFIDMSKSHNWHDPILRPILDKFDQWSGQLYAGGIDKELAAYRSGWWQQTLQHRFWESLRAQTVDFLNWTFLRCGGCILLGMALQRRHFFHAVWPRETYATIAALLIPIGWAITGFGIEYNNEKNWDENALWHFGVQFNYWGSLLTAFGYISLGILVAIWAAQRHWLSTSLIPLRSVGRMALSNYIFQSLLGTTIFYGHGLGTFGTWSRAALLPLVFATWTFQLVASTLWLRYFRQGPLEYLWHSLVYWEWPSPLLPPPFSPDKHANHPAAPPNFH